MRSLLASSPPNLSARLITVARGHWKHKLSGCGPPATPSPTLFHASHDGLPKPTDLFYQTLQDARSIYGAGLGRTALRYLTPVLQQTIDLQWVEDDEMAIALAVLDSDMTQAIQSSKDEMMREGGTSVSETRTVVKELQLRLSEASASVGLWGGEFPFERTQASLEHWKL